MHPALNLTMAITMYFGFTSLVRWSRRRGVAQQRLGRGLRLYLAASR